MCSNTFVCFCGEISHPYDDPPRWQFSLVENEQLETVPVIPSLIYHFLAQFNTKYGCNKEISARTIKLLSALEWKGNVRELQHLMERLVITTDDLVIEPSALPRSLFELGMQERLGSSASRGEGCSADSPISIPADGLAASMEAYECKLIRNAYQIANTSRKLAELLKISQSKANRLIQKYIT